LAAQADSKAVSVVVAAATVVAAVASVVAAAATAAEAPQETEVDMDVTTAADPDDLDPGTNKYFHRGLHIRRSPPRKSGRSPPKYDDYRR
jgi:ABC-type transport system substrate-binding protein